VKKKRSAETALLSLPMGRHPKPFATPVTRKSSGDDARWLPAALRLVQLEEAQIFRRCRVGRPADEGRECADLMDIVVTRLLAEAAHGHVFDHARPQRADGPR
jgi:hypothetical protein